MFMNLLTKIKLVRPKKAVLISALVFLFCAIFFFLVSAFFCLKASQKFYSSVINNRPKDFAGNYQNFRNSIKGWIKVLGSFDRRFIAGGKLVDFLPEILGQNEPRTYFVLLQNDKELRPSGGFLGSYAKLKFDKGGLKEIIIQDIYVPDGQIPGHVDPPPPIQEAFKQGWWKLRDANWDPDYPAAAKTIDWFFQKGNEEKSDGIIALNFSLFQKLIEIIGPIDLPSYQTVVDKNNFYQVAQSYSEVGFFPGSTQKRDILSSLGLGFLSKFKSLEVKMIFKMAELIIQNLNKRQILVYFKNPVLQNFFHQVGWDGSMKANNFSFEGSINDYLYIVESNLGANKANCCITRLVEHKIDFTEEKYISEKIKIVYKNESKLETPQPPVFWGGNYINYLRIYFPKEVIDVNIKFDGNEVLEGNVATEDKERLGLTGKGFFVKIPASFSKTVEVEYRLPKTKEKILQYRLLIQKQPGITFLPYILKINSKGNVRLSSDFGLEKKGKSSWQGEIFQDEEIFASFEYN